MNKSKRRVSNRKQDEEEEGDESAESLLLEENVKKLLDIDVQGPRRRNIFTDAQEPHQRIRRSIVTRALRNVISSTPMPTKTLNGNFFSTECSLNISPINSENDEHSVKEENNKISTKPIQPQNVYPDVISVSSDSSDTMYELSDNAKSKDLLSKLNTHYTRSQRKKLGEKSPNVTKSDKELIHSIRDNCKSREVNVNGINQTHIGLPELSVTLTNVTGMNANDKVDTNPSKINPHIEVNAETSERIELKTDEKANKTNENLYKSPHQTEADDRTSEMIEPNSCEKDNKNTKNASKSPYRTKSDDRTSNNMVTKNALKSPYRTRSDDRTSYNRVTKNALKSPYGNKADDMTTDNSELKSAEKCHKISKNVSVSPNGIQPTEKSYQTTVVHSESQFRDKESSNINSKPEQSSKSRKNHPCGSNLNNPDIHRSYSLKNSVNSVYLSPIQESQDSQRPARPDDCVKTASVSLRKSRRNVTLRKSSQIDSREQFNVEQQNTVGIEDKSEVGIKRTKYSEDKSSKIPVLRTRSKSREKPDELESQARNRSPGENIKSGNNSNKENKDALLSSPPKPAPRTKKKKKSALVKSSEKNHSIQNIAEGVASHTANSALLGCKTTDVFRKRFVETATSPNIFSRGKCDPTLTRSIATSTVEQVAESTVFPEEKQSLTLGFLKPKTSSGPKKVVDTAVSPLMFSNSSSSMEKEERCRRLNDIISKMTEQQSPLNSSEVQPLEGSFNPFSNVDVETQHKQVQTSLRKSGKAKRKSGSIKKHCARNIFTKTVAETQTSVNNNDDTSLSSGMTDSSKILEEFDGALLFNSLEKGPIFDDSFSSSCSSKNFDDSEVMHKKAPWRYYESQTVSMSSKRISVKLNFLGSANQLEEEKTLLTRKRLESEFDASSSIYKDSAGKIDYIDKTREKQLPRSKTTFRVYKSAKKKAAEDSRILLQKTIDSSCELDSDHSVSDRDIEGVFNHPGRMSLEKEPKEKNTEKDVEPEENTLIEIDSGLQGSQIHETTISHVEKGNSEENLMTSHTSKPVTPSRIISKKENPMILKRKSDVMTQKNHGLPTEILTDSAEKENETNRIIQETTETHSQKSIIDSYLENQLANGLSDSENEKDLQEQNKHGKKVSTHSFIGNNSRMQENRSETTVNQIQRETPTRKKKRSKTSFCAKTKFISSSAIKNHNKFPCLKKQLRNVSSDSENDEHKEKDQNKPGSSRSRINHSGNIANLADDTENIPEINQSKKIVSTHSFIGNNTRSQKDESETATNQIQRETAIHKKKGSKTLSAKTKFALSNSQNGLEIDTPRGSNNEETDSREQNAEHGSLAQFDFNTDNCSVESLEVLPADENLGKNATENSFSHTEKQRKLSVMLRKLSEKSVHRKWSRINRVLDSEDEDDHELNSSKNTPNIRNQFESFNDLAVPLNPTPLITTPKPIRTVNGINDKVFDAKEESQKKSTKKPESENEKAEEPVFKVPEPKSRKTIRKRNLPPSDDDISVTNEDSSLTGTRRSTRDRRPPKRRFVMDSLMKPVKTTNKSKIKPSRSYPVESDEQEEHINKRVSPRKKDQRKTQTTTGKRGKPKKVTPTQGYNSDKDDNLTEVPETPKRHKTNRTAVTNLRENEDNSTEGSETTSKRPKRNYKSTLNSLENNGNSTNQPKTTRKRPGTNKKTILNSIGNAINSTKGPETTSKITRIEEKTTSVPTDQDIHPMHSITTFNINYEVDTPSPVHDDPNHFEIGEASQDLDDDMFLRIPNPQNMLSQDSGTSSLLKSNTFEVSNLPSTKRLRKVNKSNKKISKVVSEAVSPRNEINIPDEKDSLLDNQYVEIHSGSEIVRLRYVENDIEFRVCQNQLSLTNFMRGMNGMTLGYLKLPSKGMKPVHIAKKHSLCYFVLEGEGKIQVHNRTSKVGKLSHFIVPLGVEYAIMNDGPVDMLLACVRVEGT